MKRLMFVVVSLVALASGCESDRAVSKRSSPDTTVPQMTAAPTTARQFPDTLDPAELQLADADPTAYLSSADIASLREAADPVLAPTRLPGWALEWAEVHGVTFPDRGWQISYKLPVNPDSHPLVAEFGGAVVIEVDSHPRAVSFDGWGQVQGARAYRLAPDTVACDGSDGATDTLIGWEPQDGSFITVSLHPSVRCTGGKITLDQLVAIADSMQPL